MTSWMVEGDRDGLEILGELIGAILSFYDLQVFQRFDMLLDEERYPFCSGQNQFLYLPVDLSIPQQVANHRQAFPIRQSVQSQLVMV
jgi:hypothetical protein